MKMADIAHYTEITGRYALSTLSYGKRPMDQARRGDAWHSRIRGEQRLGAQPIMQSFAVFIICGIAEGDESTHMR